MREFSGKITHLKTGYGKSFSAFTIAELLLAIAVIGVVAAIVIPTLLNIKHEREIETGAKKIYNVLTNGFNLTVHEFNSPKNWNWDNQTEVFGYFEKIFNLAKNCGTGSGCWVNKEIKNLKLEEGFNKNIDADNIFIKSRFTDGMSLAFYAYPSASRKVDLNDVPIYGVFYVDVNGKKNPNEAGKDVVGFWITEKGVRAMDDNDLMEDREPSCPIETPIFDGDQCVQCTEDAHCPALTPFCLHKTCVLTKPTLTESIPFNNTVGILSGWGADSLNYSGNSIFVGGNAYLRNTQGWGIVYTWNEPLLYHEYTFNFSLTGQGNGAMNLGVFTVWFDDGTSQNYSHNINSIWPGGSGTTTILTGNKRIIKIQLTGTYGYKTNGANVGIYTYISGNGVFFE